MFGCLAFTGTAKANNYLTCNTCPNAYTMQKKAEQKVCSITQGSSYSSSHSIHVASFTRGFVNSFLVTSRPIEGSNGELETEVIGQSTSTPAQLQGKVSDGYNMLSNSTIGKPIQVPPSSNFSSAWDLARDYSGHDSFDDWFLSAHSVNYWYSQFVSVVGGMWVGGMSGLEVKFVFSDGSSLIMTGSSVGNSSLRFTYKEKSARDVNGNIIPDTGQTVGGRYSFRTEQGLQAFINTLSDHGIQVTVIRGSGWMGPPVSG